MPVLKREKKIKNRRSIAEDKTSSSIAVVVEGQDGTMRRRSQRLSVKEEDVKPVPVKPDVTSDVKQPDESLAVKTETDLDNRLKPETKQHQVQIVLFISSGFAAL